MDPRKRKAVAASGFFLLMAYQNMINCFGVAYTCRLLGTKRPRSEHWKELVEEGFTAEAYRRKFRMESVDVSDLVTKLSDYELRETIHRPGPRLLSMCTRIELFLIYTSRILSYEDVGDMFGVSKNSAYRSIESVVGLLLGPAMEEYRPRFPVDDENELGRIATEFSTRKPVIKRCVGAIDGTHIPIPAPSVEPESYVNRKGFHSLVLQGVVDAHMRFMDIAFGYKGRSHDAGVFAASGLEERLQTLPQGYFLIGDAAYPSREYLICVEKESYAGDDPARCEFNYILSSLRMAVERSFGVFKGRFQRFSVPSISDSPRFRRMVTAALILHNYIYTRHPAGDVVSQNPPIHPAAAQYVVPDNAERDYDDRADLLRQRGLNFREKLLEEVMDELDREMGLQLE